MDDESGNDKGDEGDEGEEDWLAHGWRKTFWIVK